MEIKHIVSLLTILYIGMVDLWINIWLNPIVFSKIKYQIQYSRYFDVWWLCSYFNLAYSASPVFFRRILPRPSGESKLASTF